MRKLTEAELSTIIGKKSFKELVKYVKSKDKYQFINISEEFYLLFRYRGAVFEEIVLFDTKEELNKYVLNKINKNGKV